MSGLRPFRSRQNRRDSSPILMIQSYVSIAESLMEDASSAFRVRQGLKGHTKHGVDAIIHCQSEVRTGESGR